MTQTHLHFPLRSDPACVCGVRQTLENACKEQGFDCETCDAIGLCINEALANVIHHAYDHARHFPIELNVDFSDDGVEFTLRDWGSGIDPTTLPARADDPTEPGGLGLMLMRQIMDRVEFLPQPDGMVLKMSRRKSTGK